MIGETGERKSAVAAPDGKSRKKKRKTVMNNNGLSAEPWCRPTFTSKLSVDPISVLTDVVHPPYISCITLMYSSPTFSFLVPTSMVLFLFFIIIIIIIFIIYYYLFSFAFRCIRHI